METAVLVNPESTVSLFHDSAGQGMSVYYKEGFKLSGMSVWQ